METERAFELFRIASNTWQEFMDADQFHSAITCGFSAYLILREKDDERLADGALGLVRVAIQAALHMNEDEDERISCSYCGRGKPEVQLAAGAKAFICGSCVKDLSDFFASKKRS